MNALIRVVFWQGVTWFACLLISFCLVGQAVLLSSFFGGLVCIVPTLLVVVTMLRLNKEVASPVGIFVFEFIKVSLTILGLFCVASFYKNLHWLAFIMTACAVLVSHVFALASRR